MYKTKVSAQLRTKAGNKAGMTGIGDIIELSGKTIYWPDKGGDWDEISSANYFGKYIQMKYLEQIHHPLHLHETSLLRRHLSFQHHVEY